MLKTLRCVQAGFAFGVPEDGQDQWANTVAAAVHELPVIPNTAPGYDTRDIYSFQDDLLIAIQDGEPLPAEVLQRIPPFRALLIARIAERAGTGLEKGTVKQLEAEAQDAQSGGVLGEWWNRK
jgi:hypothetical protein